MPGEVVINEARSQPTLPAEADFAVCVVGFTTSTPIAAGLVSPPYSVPQTIISAWGLSDAVDCATQAIMSTPANPAPPPICLYRTPATTPGVRGATLDVSGVTGTAAITKTAATHPVGTYEPMVRVVDDGNAGAGGLIGSAGIVLEGSLNGGRNWLPSEQLGTAVTFKIRVMIDGVLVETGVQYDIGPSTTNATYVALGVELREETLDHLANAVAHDGPDTSSAQVALAASSVPATVTATNTVVNLVYAALVSHVENITSVHDGPDLVAATALTALAALATSSSTKDKIDLAIALKGILNTHLGVALAGAAAGLKAAVATIASPTTYTAGADFLAGGAAMDAQPRRPTITTANGSGSASDAPATADWSGFDLDGNPQSETVAVSQTNGGVVIATKAYKFTGLSVALVAADGTGATLTFGYSNGVHNSADVTNTVSAADPTYGTLKTGDVWSESKTTPPMWGPTDLYAAGPPATGALAAIAASSSPFAIIVITEPVAVGDLPTLTAGLNYLASSAGGGKRCWLIIRFRDRNTGETDAQHVLAFQTFRASVHDDRISCWFGSGWLTEPFRGWTYFRAGLPALVARLQSTAVVPGARGEKLAQSPGWVARGPLEGYSLVDTDGNPLAGAHDEAVAGGIDGPLNGNGGGITAYYQKRSGIAGTYISRCPTMYQSGSQILTGMDRRVADGIEMTAALIAWTEIEGADIVDGLTLDPDVRAAMQSKIAKAIKDRYPLEFQNADDPNLVSISPTVVKNGAHITVDGTVEWRPYFYTGKVVLTFSATR